MTLEIVFLGTSGAVPTKERNTSAIYGSAQGTSFLLDCGENTQKQLMQHQGLSFFPEFIVITHNHIDHHAGLIPYLSSQNLLNRTKKLKLYAPDPSYLQDIGNSFKSNFWTNLSYPVQFIQIMEDIEYIQDNQLFLKFIKVEHTILCYAVYVESLNNTTYDKKMLMDWGNAEQRKALISEGRYTKQNQLYRVQDFIKNETALYKILYSSDTVPLKKLFFIVKQDPNCVLIHQCTYFFDEDYDQAKKHKHTHIKDIVEIRGTLSKSSKVILTHFGNRTSQNHIKRISPALANLGIILALDHMRIKINTKKELFEVTPPQENNSRSTQKENPHGNTSIKNSPQ